MCWFCKTVSGGKECLSEKRPSFEGSEISEPYRYAAAVRESKESLPRNSVEEQVILLDKNLLITQTELGEIEQIRRGGSRTQLEEESTFFEGIDVPKISVSPYTS